MARPMTLLDKIWQQHVVTRAPDAPDVLYIDLHLIHEVTSPQAFATLDARGLHVHRPDRTLATMDHSTPTSGVSLRDIEPAARTQLQRLYDNCKRSGIRLHAYGENGNGIVHVVAPEQGLIRPGMTVVCGDSHTSTHGAFGALAFGIGSSEVAHVLATQCLLQTKPKSMRIRYEGVPEEGVTAKDLALATIGKFSPRAGVGHVIEYSGGAVDSLSMEGRMTLCNMSIELGARAGLIAPDSTTAAWLGMDEATCGNWRSDDCAHFDRNMTVDVGKLEPQVTWGTHPGMVASVRGLVPEPNSAAESRALDYMGLKTGMALQDVGIQHAFLGSCTNSRIEDLRMAARVVRGRLIAPGVRMYVVPGSQSVRRQAEREGIDRVFTSAGAEWRQPGCSMCIAMNGDTVPSGQYCISTSNRNFEGRQGPGARTLLASPITVAASAIVGSVADPRPFLTEASLGI